MSNRLRILHSKHKKFNKMRIYTNKNIQKYYRMYNPLQKFNRIKVIPIERIGYIIPGKNPNAYFLMAAKQALVNELTLAIETTNKGLVADPNHLFCRFLHGVLMYKLGLLVDAESDFKVVTKIHPRELAGHYNYALCLFQMGKYVEAEAALKVFISHCTGSLRALNM
jgi:tetratricopeptide (TPR) repeat protein